MEKRRLGRTGHMSTILTFGGAALWNATQAEADAAIEMAIEAGINTFDVGPRYGQAEIRLGPWMEKHHKEIFLACKTTERGKTRVWESIKRSLERLRVDHFNLYQLHGVNDLETLNVAIGPMGALEAILEARQQGLIRHIGITGHRPFVHIEALNRFEFDTVLFPVNRVIAAHLDDFNEFTLLLDMGRKKDLGTIAIKAIAKRRWQFTMHMYQTWYEPFDKQEEIDASLWYTLSQDITAAAMPADLRLWPKVIDAAKRFRTLDAREQAEAISQVRRYQPLFSVGEL